MMGSVNVPLICYCNGELVDGDRNVRYIGGNTKVGNIPSTIGFLGFRDWVREICKLSSDQQFIIKCRYRVDEHSIISIDVDDDQSLKFVFDHSQNVVIAYILVQAPELTNSTLVRKSGFDGDAQTLKPEAAAGVRKPTQEVKSASRGGRWGNRWRGGPSKRGKHNIDVGLQITDGKSKEEGVVAPSQQTRPRRNVGRGRRNLSQKIPRRCQICKEYGHNKLTCRKMVDDPAKDDNGAAEDNIIDELVVEKLDAF